MSSKRESIEQQADMDAAAAGNDAGTRTEDFRAALEAAYVDLLANDPEYAYSAAKITPAALSAKMVAGLITGSANHTGTGIKRACKTVGIKHTLTAIRAYLGGK